MTILAQVYSGHATGDVVYEQFFADASAVVTGKGYWDYRVYHFQKMKANTQ